MSVSAFLIVSPGPKRPAKSIPNRGIDQNFIAWGNCAALSENRVLRYPFISLLIFLETASSTFFCMAFLSADSFFSSGSVANMPASVPFFFLAFSRAKKSSVIEATSAPPRSTFVLVPMQYLWFARRRGTPFTLYGPVSSRPPLVSCFKNTTRRPRTRPARRIRMEPGTRPFLSLQGVYFFPSDFSVLVFSFFWLLLNFLNTCLACPHLPIAAKTCFCGRHATSRESEPK